MQRARTDEREQSPRRPQPPIPGAWRALGIALAAALGAVRCGPGGSESEGSGTSSGGVCMDYAITSEGCQIGGPGPGLCPEAPKGWSGTKAAGEACGGATECAGIICSCEDPVLEWYVGVCGCGECADYEVACAEANVVDCMKIGAPP